MHRSQEGKTDPEEDVRSFQTFITITVWKWATQMLAFVFLTLVDPRVKIKKRGKKSLLFWYKKTLRGVLRLPWPWILVWLVANREEMANTEAMSEIIPTNSLTLTNSQDCVALPGDEIPFLATCQDWSKNVIVIGYAAARRGGWLKSSPFYHCSACHNVCGAALEIQAYNPLSTLVYCLHMYDFPSFYEFTSFI